MKLSITLIGLFFLLLATPVFAQSDGDGDGVDDTIDLCPVEDASFLDIDGDGCIDGTANLRHIEFWDAADLPLSYVIHEPGAAEIFDGSDLQAIIDGFDAWTVLPGVQLSANFAGTTPDPVASGMDGINSVTFEDPEFLAVYGSAVLAVGVTTSFTEPAEFLGTPVRPGQIVDADMIFNPIRTFSTDTAGTGTDLLSVATHEAGHLFGFGHSAVITSTMFPALPAGTNARTLEGEDLVLAFMGYPDPAALATATALSGTLRDGSSLDPIGGAAVFAIAVATGDTLGAQYSFEDGSWQFQGLPEGEYFVAVSPLDGSATNGVVPGHINAWVNSIATNRLWNPEFWDLAESADDDAVAKDGLALAAGVPVTGIEILTNVDAVPPVLVEVAPDGVADVRADAVFFIEFDEAIDFDSAAASIELRQDIGGSFTPVAFGLLQVTSDNVVIVDPAGLMAYSTNFELEIKPGLKDRFGNPTTVGSTTSFAVEPAPPLTISTVSPLIVAGGTVVVIYGQGFDLGSAANNLVDFDGTQVAAMTVSPNTISVQVPADIAEGLVPLTVRTTLETSNTLTITGVVSNDFVKGTDYAAVSLGSDPEAVALLPDAMFAYVATSSGVVSVSSGFANPAFGSSELIASANGTNAVAIAPDGNRVYAVSRDGRVILVINSDYGDVSAPNATFNTVLDELSTMGEPLGIALDAAGERAYVATASGQIEVWDIELGSATYHRQIGLLESPTPSLQGAIAVDRTGLRVLALTGTGELLIFDTSTSTLPPTVTPVTSSPRDITIDPQGTLAYVTDAAGTVSVVLIATGTVSQTISVGGEPYALALTPSGRRGYVANRADDNLPAIDLDVASPSFRTVTNALPAGQQPVDVVASPDADYLLVAEQGGQELRIVGIRQGPEVSSVQPRWVREGDLVTISGSGFAETHPFLGNPNTTKAYFNGVAVSPTHSTSTSMFVPVPAGFTGGTVRVGVSGAAVLGQPTELFSNPVSLLTLDATIPDVEDLVSSVFLMASNGYPWDGVGVSATVAASPDSRFMIAVSLSNRAYMIDSDPTSLRRGEVIGVIDMAVTPVAGRMVVGLDGKFTYYAGSDGEIHILDTDPESATYLTEIGTILWTLAGQGLQGTPDLMKLTPSGEYLIVSDSLNDQLYMVDLRPGSEVYHETLIGTGPIGFAVGLAIHPSGLAAYVAATTNMIHVISLDPQNEFFQQVALWDDGNGLRDLAFTPDGSRCFVLQRPGGPTGDHFIEDIDTSDPFVPTTVRLNPQLLLVETSTDPARLFMSPNGDRMLVDLPSDGQTIWLDVTPTVSPGPIFEDLGSLSLNGTMDPLSMAFMPDGNGFWSASRGDTGINFVDLVRSLKMTPVSGQGQVGVAGQPLPAPLVYNVLAATDQPTAGAVAEVEITGGGGTLGNGLSYQWVTVDANGRLTVDWTMGPLPDSGVPANKLTISFNDGTTLADNIPIPSVLDPDTQPLAQIQVLPVDLSADVSLTSTVQVSFSRGVDRATIDVAGGAAGLLLRRQSDASVVEVAYGYSAGDSKVSMIPLNGLAPSTLYEIVSAATITDASGGVLTNPTLTTFSTQAPPPLAITSIGPPSATVGTPIVISGSGFAALASDNTVAFGAVSAAASDVGPGFITVYVPLNGESGDLTVRANSQTSNGLPFSVLVPETAPLDEVFSTVETGISIQSVAVTPDGAKAYTVSTETNKVLPVDLGTFTNLPAIPVGSGPRGVVIHPNGGTAYVTNFGSGTVSVIDTAVDEVVDTISVGANPVELVASPVGDRLYVVNQLDQTLSVIDIDASSAGYHTVVASAPTTKTTRGAAIRPDGTVLYLGTDDGFLIIELSPTSFGVVASVPTNKSTKGTAITPDGSLLLLVTTTNEVLIVDVSEGGENAVVASVPSTKTTKGAAITPDGSLLYLLQEDTDEVIVVALNIVSSVGAYSRAVPVVVDPVVVKTIPLDPSPSVVAFDPSGSGLAVVAHERTSGQLSFLNTSSIPRGELAALVDVRENELNGVEQIRGLYINVYVELPAGVDPHTVDLASVRLNGTFLPQVDATGFADSDGNGIEELVLRFDRRQLRDFLPVANSVEVIITGTVGAQASTFSGLDTITTNWPTVTFPTESAVFFGGQTIVVTWDTPPGLDIGCVDLWWTATGGVFWADLADYFEEGNPGQYVWTVPGLFSPNSIVEVVLYADIPAAPDGKEVVPSANNPEVPVGKEIVGIALSANFAVKDIAVPVLMQDVELAVADGAGRIGWTAHDAGGAVDGFNVYRSDSEGGPYQRVSTAPVRAIGTLDGMKFVFEDDTIFANRDYYYQLEEVRPDGQGFQHGPYQLNWALDNELFQNRPNTFNPRTTISFTLARDGRTRLVVYDLRGRLVDVLVDEVLRADTHDYIWDGKDRSGHSVASGVYVYRLTTSDGFAAAKKMTLVR